MVSSSLISRPSKAELPGGTVPLRRNRPPFRRLRPYYSYSGETIFCTFSAMMSSVSLTSRPSTRDFWSSGHMALTISWYSGILVAGTNPASSSSKSSRRVRSSGSPVPAASSLILAKAETLVGRKPPSTASKYRLSAEVRNLTSSAAASGFLVALATANPWLPPQILAYPAGPTG
jgi:hypothetical protein